MEKTDTFSYSVDVNTHIIAGTDEVGRGPLVGNVVAACCVLDHKYEIKGLADSKKLSEKKRLSLYEEIIEHARCYSIYSVEASVIDKINILNASLLAMQKAYENMRMQCDLLLVDGNKIIKQLDVRQEAVVKGDAKVKEIMAASILAKVTRDRQMQELDKLYPEYGFAKHKGYPTAEHLSLIQRLPILDCYRKSFAPIKKLINERLALS